MLNNVSSAISMSLGDAEIPTQMVTNGIAAILSRITPTYFELMERSKGAPPITYRAALYNNYSQTMSITPEIQDTILQAQLLVPDCLVVKTNLPEDGSLTVYSENEKGFDENPNLSSARLSLRYRVKVKDIKGNDALDHLLTQLSKKIFSMGYGQKGTFDVRLEKGCMALEGSSFQWHYDGKIFKSSITVCFSDKKKWSTHIEGNQLAEHGFLYDALRIYHRAPIPSDLKGEEPTPDDYRLFIRYNEFYSEEEAPLHKPAKQKELLAEPKPKVRKSEEFISREPPVNLEKLDLSKLVQPDLKMMNMGLNLKDIEMPPSPVINPITIQVPHFDILNLVLNFEEEKKTSTCNLM